MNRTSKELDKWAKNQRKFYKRGQLSKKRIEACESIPGWFWRIDRKREAIAQLNLILNRAKKRGNLPSQKSIDKQEDRDAQRISQLKQAKCGKGNGKFYPELDLVSRDFGYPNLFSVKDLKQEAIDELNAILDRADKRGCLPKNNSKDELECKDAQKISDLKQAKKGKGSHTLYSELEEIAKKRGYHNLFDVINLGQKAIDLLNEILDRADKRGSLPKQNGKDKQEDKDAAKISGLKQAKQEKGRYVFYPELEEIAKNRGYQNLFDIIDPKQKAIDQLNEILNRIDKKGNFPKSNSKDEQEVKDSARISQLKQAKYGRGKCHFYPELEEIAKNRGYPNLFRIIASRTIDSEKIDLNALRVLNPSGALMSSVKQKIA